jgi:plasmid segregation protein ParM
MILGVDLGNYAVKTSREVIFTSKCSRVGNLLSSTAVTVSSGTYHIGDGGFDTEYRKVRKEHLKVLFLYAVALSGPDQINRVVVGLPLSQYKQDKDELRQLLLSSRNNPIEYSGNSRVLTIDDVAVYPEGVGAVVGTPFEGIVVDIGGRTTDCCFITDSDGVKKVSNPFSLPKGTLNLYADFAKAVNSKYCLDLNSEDAERIIKRGSLTIDGEKVDFAFAMDIFKQFVDELVNKIRLEYRLRTEEVKLVGGGSQLLLKPIQNRLSGARPADNSIFANAIGFERVGRTIWR